MGFKFLVSTGDKGRNGDAEARRRYGVRMEAGPPASDGHMVPLEDYPGPGRDPHAVPVRHMPVRPAGGGGEYGYAASYPVDMVPVHVLPSARMGFTALLEELGPHDDGGYDVEARRGRGRNGRFVRRGDADASGGDSPSMRGSGGSSGKSEHGMGRVESFGEDDPSEEIHGLKRKLKKLERCVKDLTEDLEDLEKAGKSGKKKKKKDKDEDDDDDDDDDDAPSGAASSPKSSGRMARTLGGALMTLWRGAPALLTDAFGVIDQPPSSWPPYLEKGDFGGIAKMEFGELVKAVQQHKPLDSLKKELGHTAAALILLLNHTNQGAGDKPA